MKTRTWNIGEYAKGGVITVEITGKIIQVIGKQWDFKAGSTKDSDQSNAREFIRGIAQSDDPGCYRKLSDFLEDLTTSYYAAMIMTWIEQHVNLVMHY